MKNRTFLKGTVLVLVAVAGCSKSGGIANTTWEGKSGNVDWKISFGKTDFTAQVGNGSAVGTYTVEGEKVKTFTENSEDGWYVFTIRGDTLIRDQGNVIFQKVK